MILIDNYDSFTYNVVQYLKELGVNPRVFKNDEITIDELKKMDFSSIVISPGPKNPDQSGISMAVINEFHKNKKILGICLGHQCIAQYFGAKIVKAQEPMHGKVSKIYFEEDKSFKGKLFKGLEQGFDATRYHSLIVGANSITEPIKPIAHTSDGIIMAIRHESLPIFGVQFHPEAILTQGGKILLSNFIHI